MKYLEISVESVIRGSQGNLIPAVACLPLENIAGGDAGQQSAKVSLPGNISNKCQ
jgi:hypothetical protein